MKATSQDRNKWSLSDWERQLSVGPVRSRSEFTLDELEGLDLPIRRHLSQAIAPGTPITRGVRLKMRGSLKLGRWLPFRARQVLNPHLGFIWAARVGGVISGSDQYLITKGSGRGTRSVVKSLNIGHSVGYAYPAADASGGISVPISGPMVSSFDTR